jgi:hypothetical protein
MKKGFYLLLSIPVLFFYSCGNDSKTKDFKDETQLTERIQYDVLIKTPDPDLDWWTQNIEGSKRETFIKTILDLGTSGKVKAYSGDYLYTPLTTDDVKALCSTTTNTTIQDLKDPDKTHDTVIKSELDIQSITKVRFLEEWYLDENNLSFDKKVCGVMLMKESYDDSANFRGYSPLFWLYFDKDYPAKLK